MDSDILITDLDAVRRQCRATLSRIQSEYARRAPAGSDQVTPAQLGTALEMFFGLAERADSPAGSAPLAGEETTRIGDYGMQVLADLIAWAGQLELTEDRLALLSAAPALGDWISRHGGELQAPEPIVDALALAANRTSDPASLSELVRFTTRMLNAFSRALKSDLENTNPGRPWRVLHLNRAIAATRTHDLALMAQIFDELVQALPQDAPRFFAEGMSEMDRLNYPAPVRAVMERYYRQFALRKMH